MCIAKPFVKWVGGKRAVLEHILPILPKHINNYFEPFVGGGALFFEIHNRVNYSFLSDLNADLVVSYDTIKQSPKELVNLLKEHKKNHSKDYYYEIRSLQNLSDPIENSARFIYLMKTCFNGLYRVNKDNEFNTPIGSYKNPNICDEENIYAVSNVLQKAEIKYLDFSKISPEKGDFVYFDPPYYPLTVDSFTKYICNGFSEQEQIRLRDFALKLDRKGVNIMISNSCSDFIIDIYKKHFNINYATAPRLVNCKSDKRQSVRELLITNY